MASLKNCHIINTIIKHSLNLKLKDYDKSTNKFKFRVYLPKSISEYSALKTYESKNFYISNGNHEKFDITESIVVNLDNNTIQKILDSKWYYEEVKYELYNEKEIVEIINHGI